MILFTNNALEESKLFPIFPPDAAGAIDLYYADSRFDD
jgi:hypothetical protein